MATHMQPGADLEIRVALRQLARLAPLPVCLFDEGDAVFFGTTAYEILWRLPDGDMILRRQTGDVVRFSSGVAVSSEPPARMALAKKQG